jgi:hypothetical protein
VNGLPVLPTALLSAILIHPLHIRTAGALPIKSATIASARKINSGTGENAVPRRAARRQAQGAQHDGFA